MADSAQSPDAQWSASHLESLRRVKNIPVVHSAIEKTGSTYAYLKDSHYLIDWALGYAEAGLHYAAAAATATPMAKKLEGPIEAVDQKLCQGIDIVERTVPIVKEPPRQIYDAAAAVTRASLQPTIEKLVTIKESASRRASELKDISVAKANEILNTHYGSLAVRGVDDTSLLANRLLDYYFPPVENEDAALPAPVSADENKVLHAVQTIGQLSSKTANRVYRSVSAQLKTLKKEDVSAYISSVVSILHLAHFLNLADKETGDKDDPTSSSESVTTSVETANNKKE